MSKEPKILFWDIETSYAITAVFGLYPESISHNNILQDWKIICGAWKFLGKKKVEAAAVSPKDKDDFNVVKKLREVLDDVDIIVHHNGDKFDIKKFNARLIYHRLPPLPLIPTIDTLKEVRKIASFTSHRLDYLGKHLLGAGKESTSPGLWLECLRNNQSAIKEMVKYNKVDVVRLEELYLVLKPYMKNHPHVGAMMGNRLSCPKCGHDKVKKNGIRYTATGLPRQEIQCHNCHSYSKIPMKK